MTVRKSPIHLGPGLTPREAAIDAVNRLTRALDEADEELLRSAFTTDGVFDISGLSVSTSKEYPTPSGIEEIVKGVLSHIGPMPTAHYLSNFRCKLDDSMDRAEVTCYALAQHFRQGEAHDATKRDYLLMGNSYWADVVKDGEGEEALWRIKRFEVKNMWSDGVPNVLA